MNYYQITCHHLNTLHLLFFQVEHQEVMTVESDNNINLNCGTSLTMGP